ncbi:MAG TPA: ROK family protein [Candidatus Sulfotelmatobacter sp.]|nr:ROK family protein [Candidatus Sulfotelmatobacter sp.]
MSHVLAVDLGGTKCSAAVIDREGKIVSRRTEPVEVSSSSAPVSQIVRLAKDLAGDKTPKDAYFAAGVAVPGLVRRNGTVWAPNLPGWEEVPLAKRLTRSLAIPVNVESDRNAAVLGECWLGGARGKSDVVVLLIGTGIGAGILSGGRIIRGAHELSGCAGWLTVTREDVQAAGSNGELESLVAGPAIASSARQRLRNGETSSLAELDSSKITAHDVAYAARQDDRLALDIFNRAGRLLGFAAANLVSLLDPEVIILGGGMAAVADLYLKPLRQAMVERAQPLAAKKVSIMVSSIADTVNLLGCARLAWEPSAIAQQPAITTRSRTSSGKKTRRTKKETK